MNRLELERRIIIDSGSPIANHSTNQRCLKIEYDRGRSFAQDIPRKILMSRRRRARMLEEANEHEKSKIERVMGRVLAAFRGHDGFDPEVLGKEVAFLKRNGINPCLIVEDSSV